MRRRRRGPLLLHISPWVPSRQVLPSGAVFVPERQVDLATPDPLRFIAVLLRLQLHFDAVFAHEAIQPRPIPQLEPDAEPLRAAPERTRDRCLEGVAVGLLFVVREILLLAERHRRRL